MNNRSQIIVGTLFGLFVVVAWNLAMIERDKKMLNYYCNEYSICSSERP